MKFLWNAISTKSRDDYFMKTDQDFTMNSRVFSNDRSRFLFYLIFLVLAFCQPVVYRENTGFPKNGKCPLHTSQGQYSRDWLYAIIFKLY